MCYFLFKAGLQSRNKYTVFPQYEMIGLLSVGKLTSLKWNMKRKSRHGSLQLLF